MDRRARIAVMAAVLAALHFSAGAPFQLQELTQPSIVTVQGRQLIVRRRNTDGTLQSPRPYVIRGVNWSPASPGTNTTKNDPNNAAIRRPEFDTWAATDIPLMAAMHVNTVRLPIDPGFDATLGPRGRDILDQLYDNGIMVIMTVDDAINDTTRVTSAVNYYKNHPAILMWHLGNEWNINRYYQYGNMSVAEAAERTEDAAALIKTLDTSHPVSTSYGDIDIDEPGLRLADTAGYVNTTAPSVDVWGLNIYRGDWFGTLFAQWASITTKPMFLAEFGVDACWLGGAGSAPGCEAGASPPIGVIDEATQALWNGRLWNEIAWHLSARDPADVTIGGTVFEWNDEWWKVAPALHQNSGGWQGAFPDGWGNEEWFGQVSIARQPRATYTTLQTAFDPATGVPARTTRLSAFSAGGASGNLAELFRNSSSYYRKAGGGGGGRGFNLAMIDPLTGELLQPAANYDTWATRDTGGAMNNLVAAISAAPAGTVLVIAVGDEAGLNDFDSCVIRNNVWNNAGLAVLEALGATRIREYCYRDSWAMIAVKGEGVARAEQLGHAVSVNAQAIVTLGQSLAILTHGGGSGTVTTSPAGVNCGGDCHELYAPGASVMLTATPASGSVFGGWSGDADCIDGTVTMTVPRTCEATWVRVFSDHALVIGVTPVRAVHLLELMSRINEARSRAGLAAADWSGTTPAPGGTVRAAHVIDLRTALTQAYMGSGYAAPGYGRTVTAGVVVTASDIQELRNLIIALE